MEKRSHTSLWQYLQRHRVASIVTCHIVIACMLGLTWLGSAFGPSLLGAFAQSSCLASDQKYAVVSGDTLTTIAERHNISWQKLASYNHLANANFISIRQLLCIPGHVGSASLTNQPYVSAGANSMAIRGSSNVFPYGQCTWWADQRFYQLHRSFVPWVNGSNAWQWTMRASEFHWQVSSQPTAGAIINLQPGVQGASWLGHVAVVERVLGNNRVIASNLNWGATPGRIVNVEFSAGPGVTFITI